MTDKPYLSIADVAEICDVSRKTVRGWISSGDLPAFRYGKRLIRIERGALDALGRRIPTMVRRDG